MCGNKGLGKTEGRMVDVRFGVGNEEAVMDICVMVLMVVQNDESLGVLEEGP